MTFNVDQYKELVQRYAHYSQSAEHFDKFRLSVDARKQMGVDSALANPDYFVGLPDDLLHQGLDIVLNDYAAKFEAESKANLETILDATAQSTKPEELLGLTVGLKPVKGKYDEIAGKHAQLLVYKEILERAAKTKDVSQIASMYIQEHKEYADIIKYHAAHNPDLLIGVFVTGKVARAEKELVEQFYKPGSEELDATKIKEYASYLLQNAKGKDFADGMLEFAARAYSKK